MPASSSRTPNRRGKKTLFVCITLIGVFVFLELFAHAVDAFTYVSVDELRNVYKKRRDWRLGKSWPQQRGDYPYLPYRPNPDDPEINSLGFKGKEITAAKPENAYRIFCLGGSTTFNGYPEFLEKELAKDFQARGLKLEVINAGDICWTSMESLLNMITRCLPLSPDAIVVYHAVNDSLMAFTPTTSPDYSHQRHRFERDTPLIWDYLPEFLDYSASYVGFRAVFERKVGTRGIAFRTAPKGWLEGERKYHGMEPFKQNLYTLISVARARGIEVFLSTQVYNPDWQNHTDLTRKWKRGVDDGNEITRSYADRWEDVHIIDSAAALTGSNDWMTDYAHFTRHGMVKIAKFIAGGIRPHLDDMVNKQGDAWDVASHIPPVNNRPLAECDKPENVSGESPTTVTGKES